MRFPVFTFLLLLLCTQVTAQVICFKDRVSSEPVEGVFVAVEWEKKRFQPHVTNHRGEITLSGIELPVKIIASHLSYQVLTDTLFEGKTILLAPVTRKLNDIVITGQYEAGSAQNAVQKVRVIGQERIQSMAALSLQQVLAQELNIRVNYDPALGESGMTLQGIGGQNVKILLDGVPMAGREGSNVDLSQINLNNIERIEIVEGPMAINFGANALAGVINLVTKKGAGEAWHINLGMQEESIGNNYGFTEGIHNQNIHAGTGLGKNWYMQGGLAKNYFGGYKGERTDRTYEWNPKDQIIANGLVRWEKDRFKVHYLIDFLDERIDNLGPQEFQRTYAFDDIYRTKRLSQQIVTEGSLLKNHKYNLIFSHTNFERLSDRVRKDLFSGEAVLLNSDDPQRLNGFDTWLLRGTITRLKYSRWINYEVGYDINLETRTGGRISEGKQVMEDYAIFNTIEFTPTDRLSIKPGIRLAYNSVFITPPLIPALNIKYKVVKNGQLRFSVARGYRAPSLREMYFIFIDASHFIINNEALRPERSWNFNLSHSQTTKLGNKTSLQTEISAFFNYIEDRIDLGVSDQNTAAFAYINVDEYRTTGAVLNNQFSSGKASASLGFAWVGRRNTFKNAPSSTNKFLFSPELNATIGYHLGKGFSATAFYKYTGKFPQVNVNDFGIVEMGDFHIADITVAKAFKDNRFNIMLGIRNLFDVTDVNSGGMTGGVHTGGSIARIGYGRSGFVRLNFQLTKLNNEKK